MRNLVFVLLACVVLTGCGSKTIYRNEDGEVVASVVKNPDYRYYYLLTDKEYDDKHLAFLFEEMNLNKDKEYIAVKKPKKWNWKSAPKEQYTGYRYFWYSNAFNKLFFSTVAEEKANKERMSAMADQIYDEVVSGVKHYYGTSMEPVTEYCYAHFNNYTAYNSSDINKHGSSYYVRHIFKATNAFNATIKYDLMFRIDEYGNVIDMWDFTRFTQDPTLWPSDYN